MKPLGQVAWRRCKLHQIIILLPQIDALENRKFHMEAIKPVKPLR